MKCIQCNAMLVQDSKFCNRCGAKQDSECPYCGNTLVLYSIFCNQCGTKVSDAPPAPPLPGVAPQAPTQHLSPSYNTAQQHAPAPPNKPHLKLPHLQNLPPEEEIPDNPFDDPTPDSAFIVHGTMIAACRDKSIEVVVVPSHITDICKNAFSDCTKLREVYLPDSIISIRNRAFIGCTSLFHVHLSENLLIIEDGAFLGCKAIHEIKLPSTLSMIGKMAFWGCNSLLEVKLPSREVKVGWNAFGGTPWAAIEDR